MEAGGTVQQHLDFVWDKIRFSTELQKHPEVFALQGSDNALL